MSRPVMHLACSSSLDKKASKEMLQHGGDTGDVQALGRDFVLYKMWA